MKLGRYVIVDDGGNYVTSHKLNFRIVKNIKNNLSDNETLSHLYSSAIGSSKCVYF